MINLQNKHMYCTTLFADQSYEQNKPDSNTQHTTELPVLQCYVDQWLVHAVLGPGA